MATRTITAPVLRQTLSVSRRNVLATSRRFLNTETAPTIYAAHARVLGARNGHIEAETLNIDLTMAKALGGKPEGKTNPEELFAGGYGACFQGTMNAIAPTMGIKLPSKVEDSVIESTVDLVGSLKDLDIGLRAHLLVKVKGVEQKDLERLVEKAKELCPYSRATKGNVFTTIKVESM